MNRLYAPNHHILDHPVALFGNRQIILLQHNRQRQFNQINSLKINSNYDHKKSLSLLIAQQTYNLFKNKQSLVHQQDIICKYINRILKHILNHADEHQAFLMEHKILYLSFKYILCMMNQSALDCQIILQNSTTIQNWLIDVHLLFYNDEQSMLMESQQDRQEDKLIKLVKNRNYQELLSSLNKLLLFAQNIYKKKLIALTIQLVINKIEEQTLQTKKMQYVNNFVKYSQLRDINVQMFVIHKKELQKLKSSLRGELKEECQELFDLADVLVGNAKVLGEVFYDSWPLFLSFIIESKHLYKQQQQTSYKQYVQEKIYQCNFPQKNKTISYFLDLIDGQNMHTIYQSLFDLVNPYYAHLIAFFFYNFSEQYAIISILQQNYFTDIVRNLLQHSSQLGYQCFFLTIKYLHYNQITYIGQQLFEPLLYHHLNVCSIEDQEQINAFISKLVFLDKYKISNYGFYYLVIVIAQFMRNQVVNSNLVQLYIKIYKIYHNYRFEGQLHNLAKVVYAKGLFNEESYDRIMMIKQRLQVKGSYDELQAFYEVYDIFCKVFKVFEIKQKAIPKDRMKPIIQLIKQTQHSSLLLNLILQTIQQWFKEFKHTSSLQSIQQQFFIEIRQKLRYCKPQSHKETILVEQIVHYLSIVLNQEMI